MKKIYFLTLLIFLSSCRSNKDNMIVSGNVDGLMKGTLYLRAQRDSLLVNLDSINLRGDGNFKLSTDIIEPDIYYSTGYHKIVKYFFCCLYFVNLQILYIPHLVYL